MASVALALSCQPLEDVPTAPRAPQPLRETVQAHALVLAAVDCMMAPVVYGAPPWASNDEEIVTFGPESSSCMTAAAAAGVGSARLYRVDKDALLDLRRAIRRAPPSAPPFDSFDMVSLFDEELAAVMEARRARAALPREDSRLSKEAVEKIRAGAMAARLDDFGKKIGGSIGLEARAVARLVTANRFLQVARVPAEVRPYVAEPLFVVMFGSDFLSESPDRRTASWTGYVAAAARRAVARTPEEKLDDGSAVRAIGGGPRDDPERDLRKVTHAIAADLGSLAQELTPGKLRSALERTADDLVELDVESAAQ